MPVTKHTILVIDDDEIIVEIVKATLINEGHEVIFAHNGPEGLDMAKAAVPDLIILDRRMPGMDGEEVLKKLKSQPETSGIPVIMLTGVNNVLEVQKTVELGALDYVVKPFLPPDLASRVARIFGEKQRPAKKI